MAEEAVDKSPHIHTMVKALHGDLREIMEETALAEVNTVEAEVMDTVETLVELLL